MSLNTGHAGDTNGVVIFNTERILIYYDNVEMGFEVSPENAYFKGNKKGKIYLTTHRVIFVNKNTKDKLLSFSMPFQNMKNLDIEQPVFGANYIKGKVKAEAQGNWEGEGKFKMWFNSGGAIEFGQAMVQAGKLALRNVTQQQQPPPYFPPTAPFYQAPPPAYIPPSGQMYNFVPYQTFPTAPPPDSVFMFNQPPPYPSIDPTIAPFPFSEQNDRPFNTGNPGNQPPNVGTHVAQPYFPPGGAAALSYPSNPAPGFSPGTGIGPGFNIHNSNGYMYNDPYFGQGQPAPYSNNPGAYANPLPGAAYPQSSYNVMAATSGGPYPPMNNPTYNNGPYNQNVQQTPSNNLYQSSAEEKEAEAMGGVAYYDPSHPQNAYMMPNNNSQPPPYDMASKKND